MSDKPVLRVDWCSHEAAKFAVEHWHYSRTMTTPPHIALGVWENGEYIGCVLFGRGANNNIGAPYGLSHTQVAELTRIALKPHSAQVSRIVSVALKMMKRKEKGLRLIVSYADPANGHHGGIYQAMGWIYCGQSAPDRALIDRNGKRWHSRMVSNVGVKRVYGVARRVPMWGDGEILKLPGKHRYLYPLDSAMREQIAPLAKPYPKRDTCAASKAGVAPGFQPGEGGSTPTAALQEITRDDGAG